MDVDIKQEKIDEPIQLQERNQEHRGVIEIATSDSDSFHSDSSYDSDLEEFSRSKRPRFESVLPIGFLDPIRPQTNGNRNSFDYHSVKAVSIPKTDFGNTCPVSASSTEKRVEKIVSDLKPSPVVQSSKQFWKAGDYEGSNGGDANSSFVGMDHVRVHPKFLHSNATSHKWALGAFAELLDNALDEVSSGATYVNIDMLKNKKDGTKMLVVEDNGGGMTPDKMRSCMSLGYSVKSKLANTIGQYGNGFKTSTMRLGADVIVFSRCRGTDVRSPSQTIGMLSYTFLRGTGKEDIVVPMIDYEKRGQDWNMMTRSSPNDWKRNLETVVSWSPYASEEELLQQFNSLKDQGTCIVIYNLWEDDEGHLELDFDTDQHDIQIRGVNRDEKKIEMARIYPNSRHFLTYRHSLRSYASILYLRLPPSFRIILRGKDVDHHNLVNDMMLSQEVKYKPVAVTEGIIKDPNMGAVVTLGFVKDARYHIDIQGFNVYHKNRLIKPFWRVWNAAGSDGRGVIGVLEANFVEPAHDKQGFERTTVLSRLENRLVAIQKNYWSTKCHLIGYAKRRHSKDSLSPDTETTPSDKDKTRPRTNLNGGHVSSDGGSKVKATKMNVKRRLSSEDTSERAPNVGSDHIARSSSSQEGENGDGQAYMNSNAMSIVRVKEEGFELTERLEKMDGLEEAGLRLELQYERDRVNSLQIQLHKAQQKIENMAREKEEAQKMRENMVREKEEAQKMIENMVREKEEAQKMLENMDREHEALVNIFSEERSRRDMVEDSLRNKLQDASSTIEELVDKVKLLESTRSNFNCKIER